MTSHLNYDRAKRLKYFGRDLKGGKDLGNDIDAARFDKKLQISGFQKILYPLFRLWFKLTETTGKKYWCLKMYVKDQKYDQNQ